MNKHNHFTTSYYLLLKKYNESNGKLNLELSETSLIDMVGRKTTYPGNFSTSVRGKSVPLKEQEKIDPFAHLTPVARRLLENNELMNKGFAANYNKIYSTGINNKRRHPANSTKQRSDGSNTSFSPRNTMYMGIFKNKAGISVNNGSAQIPSSDITRGGIFNAKIINGIKTSSKPSPYSIYPKAQLPNVSKQRVQIKSQNERHQNPNQAYPNGLAVQSSNRAANSSSKRRDIPKHPTTSFQITNNFMQTTYGGMGVLNQTQAMNKTGYGALMYDNKLSTNQTSTSRPNKNRFKINNFYTPDGSDQNAMYLKKNNKNLFMIYKSKLHGKDERKNRSPNSPRGKNQSNINVPTNQLFVRQFVQGNNIRATGTSGRTKHSPRAEREQVSLMNNTLTGGFVNNFFNTRGGNKVNVVNKQAIYNQRY
jgi:hypothetical protein